MKFTQEDWQYLKDAVQEKVVRSTREQDDWRAAGILVHIEMKDQEKLECLVGYLPYGLKLEVEAEDGDKNIFDFTVDNIRYLLPENRPDFEIVTPILRTELTDEQKIKFAHLNFEVHSSWTPRMTVSEVDRYLNTQGQLLFTVVALEYLYSIKYDIHNLVGKGEAIASESLTPNPYDK